MQNEQPELIYFDNNATTRIAPEVFESMVPYLTESYGNPSSAYRFGARVREALGAARERVAALIGCAPDEIVFTGCGTESDNAALESALRTSGRTHVVTTAVEHSAIMKQCASFERRGLAVTYVPVAPDGSVRTEDVEKAIRPETAVVSVMWANNETGVLSPVHEIAAMCKKKNVLFHTDAVQVPGKIPIRTAEVPASFLSISGHKFHAPKGVGALFVRKGVRFVPSMIGGGQERSRRAGTENVASIIGMGRAAELALEHLGHERTAVRALRDKLEEGILASIPGTALNGHQTERLPNTTNIAFDGVESEALLLQLDNEGVCCSAGSACTTGTPEPSHVLSAMGLRPDQAAGALRFSLGRYNTEAEVDRVLARLPALVDQLRRSASRPAPQI